MKLKLVTLAAAALMACNAMAADPTAAINKTWVEYTGTGPVGNNNINNNDNAYWMFESTGTWMSQSVNSWFVFFDPRNSRSVSGDITFDNTILYVHDSKSELIATAAFGKPGVTYNYNNNLVGLEAADRNNTSFTGNTLSIRWTASNPGDHIRVMTAVPEPSSYAMLATGLLALGFMARRRRQQS